MTARKPRPMTDRQRALLRYIIRAKIENGGDSPTYDEIMHAVGITSKSIVRHNLLALERRGHIRLTRPPDNRQARSCRITVTGGRWVYEPAEEAA